jgi:hypothetical protein
VESLGRSSDTPRSPFDRRGQVPNHSLGGVGGAHDALAQVARRLGQPIRPVRSPTSWRRSLTTGSGPRVAPRNVRTPKAAATTAAADTTTDSAITAKLSAPITAAHVGIILKPRRGGRPKSTVKA